MTYAETIKEFVSLRMELGYDKYRIAIASDRYHDGFKNPNPYPSIVVYDKASDELLYVGHTSQKTVETIIREIRSLANG